jgi:transcriptional regulator with XRE-family HTH domain
MTTEEFIKILCVRLGISVAELARKCGKSPQAFSQKMKRDGFSMKELKEVAETVGCQFVPAFILPNGDRVEML